MHPVPARQLGQVEGLVGGVEELVWGSFLGRQTGGDPAADGDHRGCF